MIKLLDDPVLCVRLAAARALLDVQLPSLPGPHVDGMAVAMNDWQGSLSNRLDFPETHLQIAGIALATRRFPDAMRAFREAVSLDPQQVDAWVMIARIAHATSAGDSATRAVLTEALQANPGDLTLLKLLAELDGRIVVQLEPLHDALR